MYCFLMRLIFFFQAEDGIRDGHVTGVQTCALPIFGMPGIDQRFRHYPQLYSRLGFSHRYRALAQEELLFVLTRHWKRLGRTLDPEAFTDAQSIAAIERITRGNFRLDRKSTRLNSSHVA